MKIDPDNPKHWKIVSYGKHETESGKAIHSIVDPNGEHIDAFDTKTDAHHWLRNAKKRYKQNTQLKEDGAAVVPANNAGGGNIAGIGVGKQGEPGVNKKRKLTPFLGFIRRKVPPS